jgi:DNA-binding response OmpR family regulator
MDKAKILLVEDDLFLRDLYVENLKGEGFAVTTAEDGELALAHLEKSTWDLVLLDLKLPKLSGIEIMRIAKATGSAERNKNIIILTNNMISDPQEVEEVLSFSHEYLIKSELTPEQFIEKVKSALGK